MKTCSHCRIPQPLENFYKSKANKDGFVYACKNCLKNQRDGRTLEEKFAAREKARVRYRISSGRVTKRGWVEDCPEGYRIIQRRAWLKRYGLTEERYLDMLAQQEDKCLICQEILDCSVPNSVHIDHDHGSGQVRGILCLNCNVGIGRLKDSPDLLRRAAEYLEKQTKNIHERLYLGNFI